MPETPIKQGLNDRMAALERAISIAGGVDRYGGIKRLARLAGINASRISIARGSGQISTNLALSIHNAISREYGVSLLEDFGIEIEK